MSEAAILKFVIDNWDTIAGSAFGAALLVVGFYERFWSGKARKKLKEDNDKLKKEIDSCIKQIKSFKRDQQALHQKLGTLHNRYEELDRGHESQHHDIVDIRKAWEQSAIRDNERYSEVIALKEKLNTKKVEIEFILGKITNLESKAEKSAQTQQEMLVLVHEIKGALS